MDQIKTAGLDLDEVIKNFNSTAIARFNEKYGKEFSTFDIETFNWYEKLYGLNLDQFVSDIIDLSIFEDSKPLENAPEAVQNLASQGVEITIITSRGFHPKARDLTENWLNRYDIPFDRLEIVKTGTVKPDYFDAPVDVFIDDHLKNHRDMINSGMSRRNIVITRAYNQPHLEEARDLIDDIVYRESLMHAISAL